MYSVIYNWKIFYQI